MSFTAKQIEAAQAQITATPAMLGTAIGQAKEIAHWCMRHHPMPMPSFEVEYRRFDERMSLADPAERLLIAREMHEHFTRIKQEGEADLQRQREAHFAATLRAQNEARAFAARAHWAEAHPLRAAFSLLRPRIDVLDRRIGSVGPDGDMTELLDDLDSALKAISATAALERKAARKLRTLPMELSK